MRLTDLTVKALGVPERGQKTYWDSSLRGFGCRVSQGGTRTFVVMHGRSRQLTTIGRYPVVNLAVARQSAREILAQRVLGKTRAPTHISFEGAVTKFLETHDARASTMYEYKRILNKHFMPKLRLEQMEHIHTADLSRVIDRLGKTPGMARHAYSAASVFFNWAVSRRFIETSPLAGFVGPKTSQSRERVLSDDELATVFAKASAEDTTIGRIVRLLVLTGQRRGEVSALRWRYINSDEQTITWPPEAVKNGRQHTVPYGSMVSAILEELGREGELVFPARGHDDRSFCGWSTAGVEFNHSCGIAHWTLHDLRRTFASGMQRLGVRMEITEKLLNHVSGSFAGIVSVYQRHTYLPEMRAGVQAWEQHLQTLLSNTESINGRDLRGVRSQGALAAE